MDKFTCEYLNELTGYCGFISQGIIQNDVVACKTCQINTGCDRCTLKTDIRCLIGGKCDRDDSI